MSEDVLERAQESEVRLGIVDCDIHPMLRSQDALLPHLSRRWQEELQTNGLRTKNPFVASYAVPKATPALSRRDFGPPPAGRPARTSISCAPSTSTPTGSRPASSRC